MICSRFSHFRALIVAVTVVLALSAEAQKATGPAPDAAAIAAARDLLEVTGSAKQMDVMMDGMNQAFAKGIADAGGGAKGEAVAAELKSRIAKFAAYKADMLAEMATVYASNFTVPELKAITDFYRSTSGAKFISQQAVLTPQLMQIGIKYAQKINEAAKTP
jgi:uncharacterized protein